MTNYNIGGFVIIMTGNPADPDDSIYFVFETDIEDTDPFSTVEIKTRELKKMFPERQFSYYVTTPTNLKIINSDVKSQIIYELKNRCIIKVNPEKKPDNPGYKAFEKEMELRKIE